MDRLRTPFFIIALILFFIVVLIETGTALPGVLRGAAAPVTNFGGVSINGTNIGQAYNSLPADQQNAVNQLSKQNGNSPPGLAIPDLALLDCIVLFTVILMGLALLLPQGVHGRIQGIVTLVFSLLLLIIAIRQIFVAIGLLILMLALLLSPIFGTIAYLIIYGSFNRTGASIVLSLIMLLKFGFSGSLVAAQQRFLQNKGLVLLILSSFLATIIISILQGIVPGFLVSITDAIAAIIVGIIAVIWGIFLLIGAIISIFKVLRLDRAVKM